MTREEVIETMITVSKRLAPKYTFTGYDVEDVEQEAFIECMNALPNFDQSRINSSANNPLENFLASHLSKRLKNLKRDKYIRMEPECDYCDDVCDECKDKKRRYRRKLRLLEPLDITNVRDEKEANMQTMIDFVDFVEKKEVLNIIDRYLDVSYRKDYLKMRANVYVPKKRRQEIEQEIIKILEEHGHERS